MASHKFYYAIEKLTFDPSTSIAIKFVALSVLPFFKNGLAGVVVFFLVSGYIITNVLQTENTAEFLIKRFFRIYPLYCFALLMEYLVLANTGNTPSFRILCSQLFFVGDFFGTPYALHSVEWTLRIEVIFYIFMASMRHFNLMSGNQRLLPYVHVAIILLCGYITPIQGDVWYDWLYKGTKKDDLLLISPLLLLGLPFLLLGSIIFLYEKAQIGLFFLLGCVGLVFYRYYFQMAIYAPQDHEAHFYVLLGFSIFTAFWLFRSHLSTSPWIRVLSDMTYAVYLFHNWFFDFAKNYALSDMLPDLQALIALFIICFCVMTYVEKPGIRVGKILLTKLRSY